MILQNPFALYASVCRTMVRSTPKFVLLTILIAIFIFPLYNSQLCPLNEWCRPSNTSATVLSAEYLFVDRDMKMSWYEALDLCRRRGFGAELLAIHSVEERHWVTQQLWERETQSELTRTCNLWHVNAHLFLYSEIPAWANGEYISNDDAEFYCSDEIFKGEMNQMCFENVLGNECFAINVSSDIQNTRVLLSNVQCSNPLTGRAICKRPLEAKTINTLKNITSSSEFDFTKWNRSQCDSNIFYNILEVVDLGESSVCRFYQEDSWYCARRLCMELGATLTDIETQAELKWLKEMIGQHKRKLPNTKYTAPIDYYVDLHRYLHDPREWAFGGPQKSREFLINLPLLVTEHSFERKLCASIQYTNETIELRAVDCWGRNRNSFAICKKQIQVTTVSYHRCTFDVTANQYSSNKWATRPYKIDKTIANSNTSSQKGSSSTYKDVGGSNNQSTNKAFYENLFSQTPTIIFIMLLSAIIISFILLVVVINVLLCCCVAVSHYRATPKAQPNDYLRNVAYSSNPVPNAAIVETRDDHEYDMLSRAPTAIQEQSTYELVR